MSGSGSDYGAKGPEFKPTLAAGPLSSSIYFIRESSDEIDRRRKWPSSQGLNRESIITSYTANSVFFLFKISNVYNQYDVSS